MRVKYRNASQINKINYKNPIFITCPVHVINLVEEMSKLTSWYFKSEEEKFKERIENDERFIGLSNIQKAVQCCLDGKALIQVSSQIFGCERNEVQRAVAAMKKGRDPFKVGRPKYLREKQEEELVKEIHEKDPT